MGWDRVERGREVLFTLLSGSMPSPRGWDKHTGMGALGWLDTGKCSCRHRHMVVEPSEARPGRRP